MSDMQSSPRALGSTTVPFIFVILLLICSVIFGLWAFQSRQSYKNDETQAIASAVATATAQTKKSDAAQYLIDSENPLAVYTGPQEYGSVVMRYPKTWSAYVSENDGSGTPIDSFFDPGILPNLNTTTAAFALRFQVISQTYDQIASGFVNEAKQGTVTVAPYAFPRVPSNIGIKINGPVGPNNLTGEEIIVPVRSQTIVLWEEGAQNLPTFNNTILPNFSFLP
jgi:hypothetical protein